MKKLTYLFVAIGAYLFTSCNPMDNIYTEIDAQQEVITGDVTFTLSDDDYAALDLNYGNFNSVDDAKTKIPSLLTDKYPVWGKGSLATVSFNVYAPKSTESSLEIYTVTTADYDAYPDTATYNNFDDMSQVYRLLNDKYPNPANRLLVSLTYKFYNGSVNYLNDGFLYLNGEWNFIQGFTDDEYTAMGESYPNFSNQDEAEAKIPIFLADKFKYDNKSAGDIEAIMYKLYVGGGVTESYVMYFTYDGSSWSKYTNEIVETVKFGHDGTTWIPDNTIKYTLVGDDYVYIADQLTGNADFDNVSLTNLAKYGDFDYNWSEDQILYALGVLADHINPTAADGQKYIFTYLLYDNGLNEKTMSVIKENGVWVLNN
ncbi:MAG: hypothetical protein R3342_08605 [Lutibacter sp.]|uniref:hypothetical protein n=1 Tax=Lutibacter sp. TaxID=1925666 RepID=UPI00299EA5F2|nr:hypothetical protein [Lutibacter sp.]MDX1829591.1 hypothetical protein [Lutibacter sp.]